MASHLSPPFEGSEAFPNDGYMRRSARARKPRQFDANVVQFPDEDDVEVEDDPEQGVNAEFHQEVASAPKKSNKKPQKPVSNARGAANESDDEFQALPEGPPSDGESNDGSAYAPSRTSSRASTTILPPATHEAVYGQNAMTMHHQQQYYNNVFPTSAVDPQDLYGMAPPNVEEQVEPASGPVRAPARGRAKAAAKDTNHVKRPPNAFILYRSYACSANIIPASLRINDHRQISRIIATMWKELPAEERAVWENRAREAKEIHEREHPGYRYVPANKTNAGKPKRKAAPKKKAASKAAETDEQMRERRRCEAVAKAILAHKQEAQEQPGGVPEGDELQKKISVAMKNTATEIAAEKKHDEELRAQGIEPESKSLPKGRQSRATTRRTSGKSAQTTPSDEGPELHGAQPQWSPANTYDRGYHEYQQMPMMHSNLPMSGSSLHGMAPYQNYPAGYAPQDRHYASEQHHLVAYPPRRESIFFRDTARDLGLGVEGQNYGHHGLPSPSRMEAFPTDAAYYQPTGQVNGSAAGSRGSPVEYEHPNSPPMNWRQQMHPGYPHGQQPSFDSYRVAGYAESPSDPHFHQSTLPQTTWSYSEDR